MRGQRGGGRNCGWRPTRQPAAGGGDARCIEPDFGKQFASLAMLDEPVWQAQPYQRHLRQASRAVGIVDRFEHRRSKACRQGVFFDGDDPRGGVNPAQEQFGV